MRRWYLLLLFLAVIYYFKQLLMDAGFSKRINLLFESTGKYILKPELPIA